MKSKRPQKQGLEGKCFCGRWPFGLNMNLGTGFALDTVFCFFEKRDHSCAFWFGGSEVHGSLYLREHGAWCELTFLDIFLSFFYSHVVQPFLVFLAEVYGNPFQQR